MLCCLEVCVVEAAMKLLAALGLCALLAPLGAGAQTVPAMTVLPPPPIDAPGANPVAVPATAPAPSTVLAKPATPGTAIPIPALPSMHENAPRDARGQLPPTVKVVKHKGQLIEEYYEGGQLYMVQVHPRYGVTYTYFVDKGHQKLLRAPGAPQVNPVLYTLLTWGKPDE